MTPRMYYLQLLICALHRARHPETTSALRDQAIGLGLDAGAEPADMAAFTPAIANEWMRWLRDAGRVEVDGHVRNARHGRQERTYRVVRAEPEMAVPKPPRPRPPSMEIAAIRQRAQRGRGQEVDFYEGFAKDAARVLVNVERLLQDLRAHHARAYQDFVESESCED